MIALGILRESHVKDVRHAHRAGEKNQQHGARRATAHGMVQVGVYLGVLPQPGVHVPGTVEDAVHRGGQQYEQGRELDQGLEGDGGHQAGIALLRGDVAGAEQDRSPGA